jgi:hypothetical protein
MTGERELDSSLGWNDTIANGFSRSLRFLRMTESKNPLNPPLRKGETGKGNGFQPALE